MKKNQESKFTKFDRTPAQFSQIRDSIKNPNKILSFGCSSGEECRTLSEIYFPDAIIHGFDIDVDVIEKNKIDNKNPNIEYFSDFDETDDDYDLIICMSVLCRWPSGSKLYSFDLFQHTLLHIDSKLKVGGAIAIYNSQYLFDEVCFFDRYVVEKTPGIDTGFVIKMHKDKRPFFATYENLIFRKLRAHVKKYAVLFALTTNLGDDIQTLAAINFLSKKGITNYSFINRELLSEYNGEHVSLIMNGWFTHDIKKFRPSHNITPIFLGFHCSNEKLIRNNIDYFQTHSPIGCRDQDTAKMFEKYNVPAYFAPCLTLYFDKVKEKTDLVVDVDLGGCSYIKPVFHDMSKYYNRLKVTHEISHYWEKNILNTRLMLAKKILKIYAEASLVITSRLHAALPSLGMGTKVKFINKDFNDDPRFSGYREILIDSDLSSSALATIDQIRDFYDKYKL